MSNPVHGTVAVVGGGPAGLMAAEALSQCGARVDVYDAMPSVGRKFLLAGKGGLNLTHAEPQDAFLSRYGERRARIEPLLAAFGPEDLLAPRNPSDPFAARPEVGAELRAALRAAD